MNPARTPRRRARFAVPLLLLLVLAVAPPPPALSIQPRPPAGDLASRILLPPELALPARPEASRKLEETPAWERFRAENGPGWRLRADGIAPGAAALSGGALPLVPGAANALSWGASGAPSGRLELEARLGGVVRELLSAHPGLFRVPADELVAVEGRSLRESRDGAIATLSLAQRHEGVPVRGARVAAFVNRGNLLHLSVERVAPVREPSTPRLSSSSALERLRAHLAGAVEGLVPLVDAELFYLPVARGASLHHRLVWEWVLREPGAVPTWHGWVDARSGEVIAFYDGNSYACPFDPARPAPEVRGRVLGGIIPERPEDGEVVRGLPRTLVLNGESRITDAHGGVVLDPSAPATSGLDGRYVNTSCQECPMQPFVSAAGAVLDFGTGGIDEVPNNTSTPSDRSVHFSLNAIHEIARKWLDLSWFGENLPARTNINSQCNAFWDGYGVNLYRSNVPSGGNCQNTGEVRDVVVHEWGHGLDQNDGAMVLDAARGEGSSDVLSILLDHDSCIGEGFFTGSGCTGVREGDEVLRGTVLTVGNIRSIYGTCNNCCRGPQRVECHASGQVCLQAHWHLAQSLLNGVDAENPGLGSEASWWVGERLFLLSAPIATTYLPSDHPDFPGGTSIYCGYLLADDEGDGLQNGTPHAAYINEAFAHHEMVDVNCLPGGSAIADAPNCVQPSDPPFALALGTDPATGQPQVVAAWSDLPPGEADFYELHRARRAGDGMAVVGSAGPGIGWIADPGVNPGEEYFYWLAAVRDPDGDGFPECVAPGETRQSIVVDYPVFTAGTPVVVNDADGDGEADIGEEFDLLIPVANVGSADATGVEATLWATGASSRVLLGGPAAYPDLPEGAGEAAGAAFRLHVAPAAALCGQEIFLTLGISSVQGCGVIPVRLPVAADCGEQSSAYLRYGSAQVTDGNDGELDPGEINVTLALTLQNLGLLDAAVTQVELGSLTPGITVTDSTATVTGDLVPSKGSESTRNPHFKVDVDPGVACGTIARFSLEAGTDHGAFEDVFTLPVGSTAIVFEDDFETDLGWRTEAEDPFLRGYWERATPVETEWQPGGGNPFGTPGTAYVTGASGDALGDEVLDQTVRLVSPYLDLSGLDAATVSYSRWFANAVSRNDSLRLEVSDDQFRSRIVVLEEVLQDPLWIRSDVPVPVDMLHAGAQLRLVVSDLGDDSLTEAAVDDLVVRGAACTGLPAEPAVRMASVVVIDPGAPLGNGDGYPDPGETSIVEVDVMNVGGALATGVRATLSSPTPGVVVSDPDGSWTDLVPGQTARNTLDTFSVGFDPSLLACGATVELVFTLVWDGAPSSYVSPPHPVRLGQQVTVFSDGFETDQGWTPAALNGDPRAGAWEREVPVGTFSQPDGGNPFGSGGEAWVTGNASPGGNWLSYSVWDNEVSVASPVIDLSGFNSAELVLFDWYTEWPFGPVEIPLRVETSDDGFATHEEVAALRGSGGWRRTAVAIPAMRLTEQFQLRMAIRNRPGAGFADAVVDDVQIVGNLCLGEPLMAAFLHNGPVCDGDEVRFVDATRGVATQWAWDLDGDTVTDTTEENPRHTFPGAANWQVTLTAGDGGSGSDSVTEPVDVFPRPSASFAVDGSDPPPAVDEGVAVAFDGSAFGGTGAPYVWEWDFGDGGLASGQNVQYSYPVPGLYTVTLRVTDGNGCDAVATRQLEVRATREPDAILGLRVRREGTDRVRVSWQPDVRADWYNLYSDALRNVIALDPSCAEPDLVSPEAVVPFGNSSRYYLASGENGIGEGVLDSADVVRGMAPTPCP